MNNIDKILSDHEKTNEKLIHLFSSFSPEKINTVPFEGSWTPAQLAEHLNKSDVFILKTMNGPVRKTEREPDEYIRMIKDMLLNFSTKMENPDFNTPSDKVYVKDKLFDSLTEKKDKITEVIRSKDLTETCEGFELPNLGKLTRLEWIYFDIYHKQRHTHQLRNIFKKISAVY